MKLSAFLFFLTTIMTAGASEQLSPSPSAQPDATASRGLSNFVPAPLVTPTSTPSASPSATPHFQLRESWARLIGKGFGDVLLEANRAFDSGNYDEAIDINSFALTLNVTKGQAAVATMNRGNAYAAKGDFEHALRDLDESVTLDPQNAGGYLNRALVLRKQGDTSGAQKDYAEAARIDPKLWEVYFNRARDEAEDGDYDASIADLTKVIELRPQLGAAYVARSAVLIRTGAFEKALADCESAIRAAPQSPDAYLARARIYGLKHDYVHAEKDITQAKGMTQAAPEIRDNSIAWMRATFPDDKLRNGQQALVLAKTVCDATHWKQWQCIDTLAAAYAEVGDFENAIKYQKQVLTSNLSMRDRTKAEERLHSYEHHKPYRDETGF